MGGIRSKNASSVNRLVGFEVDEAAVEAVLSRSMVAVSGV